MGYPRVLVHYLLVKQPSIGIFVKQPSIGIFQTLVWYTIPKITTVCALLSTDGTAQTSGKFPGVCLPKPQLLTALLVAVQWFWETIPCFLIHTSIVNCLMTVICLQLGSLELVATTVMDCGLNLHPFLRQKEVLVLLVCFIGFLVGLPCVFQVPRYTSIHNNLSYCSVPPLQALYKLSHTAPSLDIHTYIPPK